MVTKAKYNQMCKNAEAFRKSQRVSQDAVKTFIGDINIALEKAEVIKAEAKKDYDKCLAEKRVPLEVGRKWIKASKDVKDLKEQIRKGDY